MATRKVRLGIRRNTSRFNLEQLETRTLLTAAVFAQFGTEGQSGGEVAAPDAVADIEGDQTITDYYWADGRQIPLSRSTTKLAVAYKAGVDAALASASLRETGAALSKFDLDRDVAAAVQIFELKNAESNPKGSLESATLALDSRAEVAWVAPVFNAPETGTELVIPDEIIVALKPGIDPGKFFGPEFSSYRHLRGTTDQYVATLANGAGLAALTSANALAGSESVEWASPNFYQQFRLATNDPLYGDQWHLNNTGQTGARNDADSDVQEAWRFTGGSDDIVISVIDSGVQTNHPDLNTWVNPGEIAGNSVDDDGNGWVDDVNGWNFVDNNNAAAPNPSSDTNINDHHGTAVAGVAAAHGNNSAGVTGASQGARVLSARIFRGNNVALESSIAEAIYYAAGRTANGLGTWQAGTVLNASWGGGTPATAITNAFTWATSTARGGLGTPTLVASGNSAAGTSTNPGYIDYTLSGITSGNYIFEWRYIKNGSVSSGDDTAWLANVHFPDGSAQLFDTTGMPAGWTTSGSANWSVVDDPAHSFGTGRYVAKAGTITHSQETRIRSPQITVTTTSELRYSTWVSSQSGGDFLRLYYSTNGGSSFSEFSPFARSGVPTVISDVAYPANLSNVLAVGASSDWDYRSAYSQYGSALDVVAPSSGGYAGITTTDRTGTVGYNGASGTSGDYASTAASAFTGTSSATPLVSGIAALMLDVSPNLTAAQVHQALRDTAKKIGGNNGATAYSSGFNTYYGYGSVNAVSALYSVYTPSLAPNMTSLTDSGVSSSDEITNDRRPDFTGAVPAASYVRLLVDGVQRDAAQLGAGVTTYTLSPTTDLSDGNHSVTIKVSETSTSVQSNASPSLPITIDTVGPKVSKVYIDYTGTAGTPQLEIKTGSELNYKNETVSQQLMSARIGGVFDRVRLDFNESVDVQQADLKVLGDAGCGSPAPELPQDSGGFAYSESGGFFATWDMDLGVTDPTNNEDFFANQILLKLNADASGFVRDKAGNALDGDWTNPTAVADVSGNDTFPSGDATAGNDFEFRMTVLRSDINRDGNMNGQDINPFTDIMLGVSDTRLVQFDEGDLNSSGAANGQDISVFTNDILYGSWSFASWPGCGGGDSLMGGDGGGEEMMLAGGVSEGERRAAMAADFRAAIDSYLARGLTPNAENLAALYQVIEELEAAAESEGAEAAAAVVVANALRERGEQAGGDVTNRRAVAAARGRDVVLAISLRSVDAVHSEADVGISRLRVARRVMVAGRGDARIESGVAVIGSRSLMRA